MKKKPVYAVTAEVTAKPESDFAVETGGAGAFMNAFVAAGDALEAGRRVKKALEEDLFENVVIEEIILGENFEIDPGESGIDYRALKKEAAAAEDVVYGEFFLFEEE